MAVRRGRRSPEDIARLCTNCIQVAILLSHDKRIFEFLSCQFMMVPKTLFLHSESVYYCVELFLFSRHIVLSTEHADLEGKSLQIGLPMNISADLIDLLISSSPKCKLRANHVYKPKSLFQLPFQYFAKATSSSAVNSPKPSSKPAICFANPKFFNLSASKACQRSS